MSNCVDCEGSGVILIDHCQNPECRAKPARLECDTCGGSGTLCDMCSEMSIKGEHICRDCCSNMDLEDRMECALKIVRAATHVA
jgi:hypothetical protein